jgi:hypothetical protein
MIYFIFAIYGAIVLIFILLYIFVVYHLAKYSINSSFNRVMLPFFIVISTLLLFANIIFFFSVDWSELVSRLTFAV